MCVCKIIMYTSVCTYHGSGSLGERTTRRKWCSKILSPCKNCSMKLRIVV